MVRRLYYLLPPYLRLIARRLVFLPYDLWCGITGKREEMLPPRGMIYTGSGDFVNTGNKFLKLFIKYGKLMPHHRVLDIGSGIGRIARPLTSYLLPEGSYEGFDLVNTGVKWCKKNISTKYPNFNFQKVDLLNDLYTSKGIKAEKFVFPYKDDEFDFVFLISVFTHMLPEEVDNYIKEIKRVLKKGGKCFATFFILNEKSIAEMQKGKFIFSKNFGNYRLMDEKVKAANVAFHEDYLINDIIKSKSFNVNEIIYGDWFGNDESESLVFQDIVVFEK
jgi:SAM-dependent methyltransferase